MRKTIGSYLVERELGRGGMGVVYRAIQEPLDREVALKLIRPELLYQDETRERFARSTSIIARLQPPGIVPIFQIGSSSCRERV